MHDNRQTLKQLMLQIRELSPENRLRLMQSILETVVEPITEPEPSSKPLPYGKYKGDENKSTLEDFALAEWRTTDAELGA